ncbi:class I SAM-dependent methyltransferase [Planococcus lenghuensis]|uniref:16S rRNA methyltransferase n=1 Tax=Planococcus lenghuensis TaxID=2213202 RepID=A0A1Q2KUF2_9BACL|nr:class I SAM-dependent methyltransferase [Planococcus lenghuensis]AQQ51756.1 16S rRNA methyltransferase [Planococcus lenghuensis]
MSQHYYSKNPQTQSSPQEWIYQLRGQSFRFHTDSGVFSRQEVDFGSRLLIETFELPETDGPIADIGAGYGPIGLAAAKSFPDREVHLVDVNTRALELAGKNAAANGIENIRVYESDALQAVGTAEFAAILTNPPIRAGKDTVFRFYEEAYAHLAPGGELWVVIQKKQGAPSTEKKLDALFGNVRIAAKEKGYFIFCSIKN